MAYRFSTENIDSDLLNILLKDRTTEKNIIWATNDHKDIPTEGEILAESEIKTEQINLIKPRFEKFFEQQKNRTRDKAEIFTPSWLCNAQNNLIDEVWFGKADVFNKIENNRTWKTNTERIIFDGGKSWQSYVESNRLEIACGEAPYLVSRYDAVSGEPIPVENRIGLLDRKLRVVGENTSDVEAWLIWAQKAVQSIYGYEFQGDNLFIARCNVFLTVREFFFEKHKFERNVPQDFWKETAEIISWNLWQMNGRTNAIPYAKVSKEQSLFDEPKKNVYCQIKDWKENIKLSFESLLEGVGR